MDELLEIQKLKNKSECYDREIEQIKQRLATHGNEIDDLRLSFTELKTTLGRIDLTVISINEKLNVQYQKPMQRWDMLISQIITLTVAAIVGAIFARVGL